jgi:hypothetical protein
MIRSLLLPVLYPVATSSATQTDPLRAAGAYRKARMISATLAAFREWIAQRNEHTSLH